MSNRYDVITGANVHLAAAHADANVHHADGWAFLTVGQPCFTVTFSGTPTELEGLAYNMLAAVDAAVDAAEVAS
jgi:hypothetical protein